MNIAVSILFVIVTVLFANRAAAEPDAAARMRGG
jgi:hypothetical protein